MLFLGSCATFRPMPTHAGGKRFDEEERVLSATIFHAAGKMDFSKFKKRKVAIEVTSLETTGATEIPAFPGMIQSIPIPISQYFTVDYRLTSKLNVKSMNTRQDVDFLQSVLTKRLRFDGYQVTSPEDADIYLVVLVDVLGTDYNRDDYLIAYKDNVEIGCEMTYYAVDAHTQKIITKAKAVASTGNYCEVNYRPSVYRKTQRSVTDFTQTIVPLPALELQPFSENLSLAPVSDIQPIIVGKKKTRHEKKKSKKKKHRKALKRSLNNDPLPDFDSDSDADSDLLPDLTDGTDTGETPNNDVDQQKIKTFAKRAQKRIEGNDIDGAKKQIERIRKLDPNASVLSDLEKQVKAAEEKENVEKQEENSETETNASEEKS